MAGHPAVGEADHRPDPTGGGGLGGANHVLGLLHRVGERLLAQHVLARLERRHRDLGVGVTGGADVDDVDVVALEQAPPVGLDGLPAEAVRRVVRRGLVASGDSRETRDRRGVEVAAGVAPGLRVGAPHEGVADHPHPEDRLARVRHVVITSDVSRFRWFRAAARADTVPARAADDQDSKPSGRYCSTFSLVTTGALSTMRLGTSTWTRSLRPLFWAMRRASLMPSAACVGG